jgi:DNA replication protein DnaC
MDDDDFDAERERRERVRSERLARWVRDIPPVFSRSGDLHPDVLKWVDGLRQGRATNLILVGPTGTTKTWHCYHAITAAFAAGWPGPARMLTAPQWKRAITPSTKDDADLDRMAETGLLVLDDLGSTRVVDWDAENMLGVLDTRWKFRRPTMVTSNVADLRGMLGERIASRLGADHMLVTLTGPDRRRER